LKLFDSHFHIIDDRYPLIANQGYLPDVFSVSDYQAQTKDYHLIGGAVVSGSFQAFDQNYLIDALKKFGAGYVGVTQLPPDTSDEEIIRLNTLGVRALRFNLKRGGSAELKDITSFGQRVYDVAKWHVELYVDSKEIGDLISTLSKLKQISIDHLGLSKEGFPALKKLVEKGAYVKASGFGRVNFNIAEAVKELCAINPDAIVFGTDLPSTRAPRPFMKSDIDLICDHFDHAQVEKILYKNALKLYRLV
jgi:predicted TIM-barrel fold metal-dependent hydrolase